MGSSLGGEKSVTGAGVIQRLLFDLKRYEELDKQIGSECRVKMNFSSEDYAYYIQMFDDKDFVQLMEVATFMTLYIQPLICGFGFLVNFLATCVFISKYLRLNSSNFYLASLSGSSCVYMLSVLLAWLEVVQVPVIHRDGVCQTVVFLTYVTSFLTVWLVTVITFEHYVIVHHITAVRFVCQRRKAKILVSCLVVLSIALYSMSLWSTGVENKSGSTFCTPRYGQTAIILNHVLFYIDTLATLLLPGILTLALICACVSRQLLWRNIAVSCLRHHRNVRISRRERSLLRIARALLLISISHVMFSGPSFIFRLRYQISTLISGKDTAVFSDNYINAILQILYYVSFTANFIIYVVFCANFRLGLKSIFHLHFFKCNQH